MAYFVLAEIKKILKFREEDSGEDALLADLGTRADAQIDNDISPFVATIPLTGTIPVDVIHAANIQVVALYKLYRKDIETAKIWFDTYKMIIKGIITRLQRTPATNPQSIVYASSYQTEPLKSRDA